MMKLRKLFSCLTTLALALGLSAPALAAETPAVQDPSPWAYSALADSYAMGLVDDNYTSYILSSVTTEQLSSMTAVVADKLALLALAKNEAPGKELVIDSTRGGVMNALYQEAAAYAIPGIEKGTVEFLTGLGVVSGDQKGNLHAERTCTYQEAMVMAQRLILAVYDQNDAGSKGLLWKATNGDNTLYLLGTIHLDRSNVYPFHRSLRDAIASSQEVIFELDLNDQAGMAEFQAMQTYSDGTGLKDHISPELYADTVAVFTQLGMTEEQVNTYKPWVLTNTLNVVIASDDTTSGNAMAIDSYVNAAAANAGKKIGAVETYAFQGAIFNELSDEYQESALTNMVALGKASLSGEVPTEAEQKENQQALEHQAKTYDDMMNAWKSRDPEAFLAVYPKDEILNSDDELSAKLFTERDPNMIKAAAAYLETEGSNTFFMAVGAGHMVDPGGIVGGLRDLGYTVELVK